MQLDLFTEEKPKADARFIAAPAGDIDDRIIDAALHHVEKQSVLRQIKSGKSWSEAAGIGGCFGRDLPYWQTGSKGIEVGTLGDPETHRFIPIPRIMQRVAQYYAA